MSTYIDDINTAALHPELAASIELLLDEGEPLDAVDHPRLARRLMHSAGGVVEREESAYMGLDGEIKPKASTPRTKIECRSHEVYAGESGMIRVSPNPIAEPVFARCRTY